VALDRQSIARRDFPTNRRGYDPAAVDAHLAQLADEVEALQRRAAEPATLSSQAGEQVKAIVQAAERGAQEIREAAAVEAREHVARVTAAADRLRARIEQVERDIVQLGLDLRTNAERLHDDLAELQAGVAGIAGAASEPRAAPAPAAAPEPAAAAAAPSPAAEPDPEPGPQAPAESAAAEPEPAPPAPPPAASGNGDADAAAARIVALDMALSGTPREETDRYLAEHYDVADRAALLDEVYAAAGDN
jgi:DivIVA domain-containing protein